MSRSVLWSSSLLGVAALAAPLAAQTTTCEHVGSAGIAGDGWADSPVISPDGRWVAFYSFANNLVPGDFGNEDVFVHDRITGATELVSSATDGTLGDAMSMHPTLSADARWVAFYSFASNLVAGDTNGTCDVFLKDRQTGTTTLVSLSFTGGPADNCSSAPAISADGRWVAFESSAHNLVSSPATWVQQIYRRDVLAGTTQIVSRNLWGEGASSACYDASISNDGRWVAFATEASDLVAGDNNSSFDVFVCDVDTGTIERASVWTSGAEGKQSYEPHLSGDGRSVVFQCLTALSSIDLNNTWDVYVRELDSDTTRLISRGPGGVLGDGPSRTPTFSRDGRWVAFRSRATNFAAGNDDRTDDIYVYDRIAQSVRLAGVATTGALPNDDSSAATVSDDGQTVAYVSFATNLVVGDVNGVPDVFASDASFLAPVAGYGTAKTNGQGCVPAIGSAGAPRASGADAFFVTGVRVLNQKSGVFFWGRASANLPFGGGTLWVQPPLVRSPLLSSGGSASGTDCTGAYSFHFAQSYMSAKLVLPGDTLFGQFWSRDPGFTPPDNVGLTDAVTFTVAP